MQTWSELYGIEDEKEKAAPIGTGNPMIQTTLKIIDQTWIWEVAQSSCLRLKWRNLLRFKKAPIIEVSLSGKDYLQQYNVILPRLNSNGSCLSICRIDIRGQPEPHLSIYLLIYSFSFLWFIISSITINCSTLTIVSKHELLSYFIYVNSIQPSQLEEHILYGCEVVSNKKKRKKENPLQFL